MRDAYYNIFYELNEFLEEIDKNLNSDFINLFEYVIIQYARNVFKFKSNWSYVRRSYSIDYDYINSTNCVNELLSIQKELKNYHRIFKKDKKLILKQKDKYIKFIKDSMSTFLTTITKPLIVNSEQIKNIIEKYKYLKKMQRSPKLNYDVLEKLNIVIDC